MKNEFKLLAMGALVLATIFCSCSFLNSGLKEKTFNKKADSAKVVKLIFEGGGDFNIVFKTKSGFKDTLYVGGYGALYNEIDTLTIIDKKSKSYWLYLTGLKNEKGKRYNDSIDIELIY